MTNVKVAELLNVTTGTVGRWRKEGLPDSDDIEVLKAWVSKTVKSVPTYELGSKEIAKVLNLKTKHYGPRVGYLRTKGLPNTSDKKVLRDWFKDFTFKTNLTLNALSKKLRLKEHKTREYLKLGMPRYDVSEAKIWVLNQKQKEAKIVTLNEIGIALGLTRERVRQLVAEGMPFNESDTPIQDAMVWMALKTKTKKELTGTGKWLHKKGTQKTYKANKLSITFAQLKEWENEGMPSDSLDSAKKWIKDNKIKSKKGWVDKTNKRLKVIVRQSLGMNNVGFDKLIEKGMPPYDLEEAKLWIAENCYVSSKGGYVYLTDKKRRSNMCKGLKILARIYEKFVKLGMPPYDLKEAKKWMKTNAYKTQKGVWKIKE